MKIKNIIFVFITPLLFITCKSRNKKINNAFSIYIEKDLKLKINNNHLYIVFSTKSCHSCVDKVLQKINKNNSISNTTIILSGYSKKYFNYILEKLKVAVNVKFDLKETEFAIKYLTASKTVIYYRKNDNEVFKQFDYSEIDDALSIVEKFYINEN